MNDSVRRAAGIKGGIKGGIDVEITGGELSIVDGEGDGDYDGSDGDWYVDAITGARRRRRGKARRHSRGPMSDSEYLMSRQFQHMLTDLRRMHGSLADVVAKHFTAEIAAYRTVLREYSYENVPEPDVDDVREIKEAFGIAERPVCEEEFDLGKLT